MAVYKRADKQMDGSIY